MFYARNRDKSAPFRKTDRSCHKGCANIVQKQMDTRKPVHVREVSGQNEEQEYFCARELPHVYYLYV